LDNTKITGSGFEHLKNLTELTEISVQNAKLTDEGLKHLHVFKESKNPKSAARDREGKYLEDLFLGGNNLSDEAVNELRAVLPHCEIYLDLSPSDE